MPLASPRLLLWLLPESLSTEWVHVVLRLSKMSKSIWPKVLSNDCFCTGSQECVTFCPSPLRAEFFFPTAPWISQKYAVLAFKAQHSRNLAPGAGPLHWGIWCESQTLPSLGRTCVIVMMPLVCGSPAWCYGSCVCHVSGLLSCLMLVPSSYLWL